MIVSLALFALSMVGVWVAAGMVINGVSAFAHRLKTSSFTTSFFILGALTSIPELSVGLNAIHEKTPDIFTGNLVGASLVLFLLVIPVFAVIGNGVTLSHDLTGKNLPLVLFVIFIPALAGIDGSFTRVEAVIMLLLYAIVFFVLRQRKNLIQQIAGSFFDRRHAGFHDLLLIIFGAVIMYFSSQSLVHQTVTVSNLLGISTFLMSLIVLGVATNAPELMIGIRSILRNEKSIAFGNYVGSAAANTLLFGGLVLLNGSVTVVQEKVWIVFVFFLAGLIMFFFFSRSKTKLSRNEGLALLFVYIAFVLAEMWRRLIATA